MPITVGLLLLLSFVVSLAALGFLMWAIFNRQLAFDQADASVVFEAGENRPADAAGSPPPGSRHWFDTARAIDPVSARPVLVLLCCAIFWLVVASLKLHWPDWLDSTAALTFGRARTLHLNLVIYGWSSLAGIAAVMWIIPRIFHTPLRYPRLPVLGAILWNIGVVCGGLAIASGWTDGEEWLEFPWPIDIVLALGGVCFTVPLVATARAREVEHIYVSGWYFLAALLWFPVLFVVANIPYIHWGAEEATVNWWFAHNVLGLWLTPLGVGTAYYFIPKIVGKPIYSYGLSVCRVRSVSSGWGAYSTSSSSQASLTGSPGSFPAASSNASRWRSRS